MGISRFPALPGISGRYSPVFLGPNVLGQQVDHGYFWPDATADLGTANAFHWDAIVAPNGDGYLVSDGYGGAHALLWGWLSGQQSGNIRTDVTTVSFGGHYTINPGEWVHLACDWDGANVRVFVNGIMDGQTVFVGPRYSVPISTGGGKLYVMGSDHINAGGNLAHLRAWEQVDIYGAATQARILPAIPERRPGFEAFDATVVRPCHFWCDYTRPGNSFPDLSPIGYRGRWHPGRLQCVGAPAGNSGALANRFSPGITADMSQAAPLWGRNDNCPLWTPVGATSTGEVTRTPGAVPVGARCFDGYERPNQTYFHQQTPTLGSTEGGSQGPLAWQAASTNASIRPVRWGILGGYAIIMDQGPAIAYVDTGSATQDIQVTRRILAYDTGETGIAFRVQDGANWWIAYYTAAGNNFLVAKVVGNAQPVTQATYHPVSTTWTKMRVTASGSTLTFYVDAGGSSWTTLGSITDATFASATSAGIGSGAQASLTHGLMRWKNWTAF